MELLRINLFIILKGGEKMKKIMTALLLAMPTLVSAQSAIPPSRDEEVTGSFGLDELDTDLGKADLKTTIGQLINVVLGFLGIIAVLIILLGGFKWMTSQGSSEKVEEAKKLIGAGIVGLIIILASYAIAQFVLTSVYDATTAE